MKDIVVQLAGKDPAALTKEEVLKIVDAELDDFSRFMNVQVDWKYAGPLTKNERLLLRSYLMQKLFKKIE